jgi:hypothetical protein
MLNLNCYISHASEKLDTRNTCDIYICYSEKHFKYHEIQKHAEQQIDQRKDQRMNSWVSHIILFTFGRGDSVILWISSVNPFEVRKLC